MDHGQVPLGNMCGLAKRIAPDRAKRAGVGCYSERTFLINKKFLTGPASNLHIPNDSVALCLKQTFCDSYHYIWCSTAIGERCGTQQEIVPNNASNICCS